MLTIKKGDTRNAIRATLKKNGEPVNLTGCTVLFYMDGKVNGGHAQVVDAEWGKVVYPLEANAVDKSGVFRAEFKVIHPDGRQETFPDNGYIKINIIDDLKRRD